jgi:hypothetical protein
VARFAVEHGLATQSKAPLNALHLIEDDGLKPCGRCALELR